uniref:Uncharacterized protein n=1 Tax=Denticeps clupeoides TaxID=299321 RepID=A0AAY4AB92_9TELE
MEGGNWIKGIAVIPPRRCALHPSHLPDVCASVIRRLRDATGLYAAKGSAGSSLVKWWVRTSLGSREMNSSSASSFSGPLQLWNTHTHTHTHTHTPILPLDPFKLSHYQII